MTMQYESIADRMIPYGDGFDVGWPYLEKHLQDDIEETGLDIDPPFQRAHVWSDAQRVAFIEAVICGVSVSNRITIAHVGRRAYDMANGVEALHAVLLDGKQRLETIRRFIRGELRVFAGVDGRAEGYTHFEMADTIRRVGRFSVEWRIVVVPTWEDVLRLYILMNGGGTPHTAEELDKVRVMLASTRP